MLFKCMRRVYFCVNGISRVRVSGFSVVCVVLCVWLSINTCCVRYVCVCRVSIDQRRVDGV